MSSPIPLADATPPIADAGAPPTPEAWAAAFAAALPYDRFLDRHATPEQRERWNAFRARVSLTDGQRALLGGFVRRMPVLVLAGAWCGDCVNQCPIFAEFAAAAPAIAWICGLSSESHRIACSKRLRDSPDSMMNE